MNLLLSDQAFLAATAPAGGALLPLDAYPNATAAYSLRNLSKSYTAAVVRVRRSSDNTEQDFTATQVVDGTLTTFCGAGDGLVRTWYDQSGNNQHAGQATTTQQTYLVYQGTLQTINGKPAIWTGPQQLRYLATPSISFANTTNYWVMATESRTATTTRYVMMGANNNTSLYSGVADSTSTSTVLSSGFGAAYWNGILATGTRQDFYNLTYLQKGVYSTASSGSVTYYVTPKFYNSSTFYTSANYADFIWHQNLTASEHLALVADIRSYYGI